MKLLVIGDEQKVRRMVVVGFATGDYEVRTANTRSAMEGLLAADGFHAACVDWKMKEDDPGAIVDALHRRVPRLPIVALAGPEEEGSLSALRSRGVCANLRIPFSVDGLRAAIADNALSEPVGGVEGAVARVPAESVRLIANDDASRRAHEIALRAATSNVTIPILGETGTGKSMLAQSIHQHSGLRHGPFVTVSCPCLSRELLESDLFGHVRGSFTGAVQDTWGKVAAAAGGTLFLDEIGDMPAALQPKLLRLLQEKQYERVGETTPRAANARIIAATNRNLKEEVAAGRFREDLYYRLNVIAVDVPPLRHRPADIVAAAGSFLAEIDRQLGRRRRGLTTAARRLLEGHSWPGNLRELRNAIERAAILSEKFELDADDFPSLIADTPASCCQIGSPVSLAAIESAHIQMVIANSSSLEEAARILGIDKSTLYRKRKQLEGRVTQFAPELEPAVAIGG